jgi:hypothetical protein
LSFDFITASLTGLSGVGVYALKCCISTAVTAGEKYWPTHAMSRSDVQTIPVTAYLSTALFTASGIPLCLHWSARPVTLFLRIVSITLRGYNLNIIQNRITAYKTFRKGCNYTLAHIHPATHYAKIAQHIPD